METIGWIFGCLLGFIIYVIKTFIKIIVRVFNLKDKAFQHSNLIKYEEVIANKQDNQKQNDIESFKKGEEFENFVRANLFSKEIYTVIEKTHSYEVNKEDYVESTLKPDFKFRHKKTGKEFYVEAKWRQNLFKNYLQWSKPYQFNRYKKYANDTKLFIVIGLGGTPNNPDRIFLEDIDRLNSFTIKEQELNSLEFNTQRKKYRLN